MVIQALSHKYPQSIHMGLEDESSNAEGNNEK